MIKDIRIKNYRCFEDLKLRGLSRINLFGGLNNVGKTALLEALYLMTNPTNETLKNIYSYRNAGNELCPIDTWFYNRETNREIAFQYKKDDSTKSFRFVKDSESNLRISDQLIGDLGDIIIHNESFNIINTLSNCILKSVFIPVIFKQSVNNLPEQIDHSKKLKTKSYYIQSMQLIDSSIVDIFTFASEPELVYIEKGGGLVLPLDHQGDALRKVVTYVSHILEGEGSILLIDEIDNGLHPNKQEVFWEMLFKLCIQFDVQVFANTHNLEMIKAYSRVVQKNNWESETFYFEL